MIAALRLVLWVLAAYYGFFLAALLWMALRSWLHVPRAPKPAFGFPGVSLLIPVYNCSPVVVRAVEAALTALSSLDALRGRCEVIVIDDGSRDDSVARLTERFALCPVPGPVVQSLTHRRIRRRWGSPDGVLQLVEKLHGGKGDALNAALALARHEVVATLDVDCRLDASGFGSLLGLFANRSLLAAGGVMGIGQPGVLPAPWLGHLQCLEYLRAFLVTRPIWSHWDALYILPGACTAFRRDGLRGLGGFSREDVSEDLEIIFRLRWARPGRRRIGYLLRPVVWTEPTLPLARLIEQRRRWHRGLLEVLARYIRLFRHQPVFSLLALPYLWFYELLSPILELVGLVALPMAVAVGITTWRLALIVLAFVWALATVPSLIAIGEARALELYGRSDWLRLTFAALLEPLGYRPLTTAARLLGMWDFLRGVRRWPTARERL